MGKKRKRKKRVEEEVSSVERTDEFVLEALRQRVRAMLHELGRERQLESAFHKALVVWLRNEENRTQ